MTSKGHIPQLVNEAVGKRKRGDPQEKRRSSEEKTVIPESSLQSNLKTDIILLWLLRLFASFTIWTIILLFVLLLILTLSTIQLLKQTWSPLVRKDSQTRGFSAN